MQITITQWKDEYADAFRDLSLEWLTKYVEVEPRDVETFDHPHETVLDPGGMIWFALADGVPVGTIGLAPEENGEWELIKLAVTQDFQGYGIGRQLIETVIQRAKKMHLKKLVLFTNSKLQAAVHLYERYGFVRVALRGAVYKTSDLKMELTLS